MSAQVDQPPAAPVLNDPLLDGEDMSFEKKDRGSVSSQGGLSIASNDDAQERSSDGHSSRGEARYKAIHSVQKSPFAYDVDDVRL